MNTSQREAKAAKELRPKVAKLQAEILKAGEMIVRYHRRLSELIRPSSDGAQRELMHAAYTDEINRKFVVLLIIISFQYAFFLCN